MTMPITVPLQSKMVSYGLINYRKVSTPVERYMCMKKLDVSIMAEALFYHALSRNTIVNYNLLTLPMKLRYSFRINGGIFDR